MNDKYKALKGELRHALMDLPYSYKYLDKDFDKEDTHAITKLVTKLAMKYYLQKRDNDALRLLSIAKQSPLQDAIYHNFGIVKTRCATKLDNRATFIKMHPHTSTSVDLQAPVVSESPKMQAHGHIQRLVIPKQPVATNKEVRPTNATTNVAKIAPSAKETRTGNDTVSMLNALNQAAIITVLQSNQEECNNSPKHEHHSTHHGHHGHHHDQNVVPSGSEHHHGHHHDHTAASTNDSNSHHHSSNTHHSNDHSNLHSNSIFSHDTSHHGNSHDTSFGSHHDSSFGSHHDTSSFHHDTSSSHSFSM